MWGRKPYFTLRPAASLAPRLGHTPLNAWQGAFGSIYKGSWNYRGLSLPVAVKQLRREWMEDELAVHDFEQARPAARGPAAAWTHI